MHPFSQSLPALRVFGPRRLTRYFPVSLLAPFCKLQAHLSTRLTVNFNGLGCISEKFAFSKWITRYPKKELYSVRWVDRFQAILDVFETKRGLFGFHQTLSKQIKFNSGMIMKTSDSSSQTDNLTDQAQAPNTQAETKEGNENVKGTKSNGKPDKKEKKKKEKKPTAPKAQVPITPTMIDLRVGHIEKVIKHPNADSLYVSTINMGDPDGPRTVCSGLVNYFSLEQLQDRNVVVVANLKPVNMRGIKSSAMVLCASNQDSVEFVNPPAGSKPGDKIFFEGFDGAPEPTLNPKKKVWEQLQAGFSTNADLDIVYKKEEESEKRLVNKDGKLCKVDSMINAIVR